MQLIYKWNGISGWIKKKYRRLPQLQVLKMFSRKIEHKLYCIILPFLFSPMADFDFRDDLTFFGFTKLTSMVGLKQLSTEFS